MKFLLAFLFVLLTACVVAQTATPVPPQWRRFDGGIPTHAAILALAVDPRDARTLYAGAYDQTGLYISTDQARSWRAWSEGLERSAVLALQFVGNTLYAGTIAGFYRLKDARWQRIEAIPPVAVYSIYNDAPDLYVATDARGIYHSADAGKTWRRLNGLDGEILTSILALDAQTLIAGTGGNGAFFSRDGGATWRAYESFRQEYVTSILAYSHTLFLRTRAALWRSRDDGIAWEIVRGGIENEIVHALLRDAFSPRLYAATGSGSVFASDVDGAAWQKFSNGLPSNAAALSLAQLNADTVLAGTQTGIWITRDRGESWQTANAGIGAPPIHALALGADGALFAATEDGLYRADASGNYVGVGNDALRVPILSIARAPSDPHVMYAGSYRRGIFKSEDSGKTWRAVGGIFRGRLAAPGVAVSPHNENHVFARVLFERIYKTDDGGDAWHAVWTGMPVEAEVETLTIAPSDPRVVYAGTNDGFYASADGGEAWTPRGLESRSVLAIWVDPRNARRVWAGATDGLYASDDAGLIWNSIGMEVITVTAIARLENSFVVGTKYNGVWLRRDDTKTLKVLSAWTPFGLPNESIVSLVYDDARVILYAATPRGIFKMNCAATTSC
ncbi:MAG: hypothetical protein HY327_06755 [Chloroflexi bacterium]|nr:hypothetical protein [Chloroflexota bacterium]